MTPASGQADKANGSTDLHPVPRPRLCDDPLHRLGRPVRDNGTDGFRQPGPRRIRDGRRLRHGDTDEPLRRAVRAGLGDRIRRDGVAQRGARTRTLRPPVRRERTGPGAVHHRFDLHVRGYRPLPMGPAAATGSPAASSQRSARFRLPHLPHLSLVPDRGRLHPDRPAMGRDRAHQVRRPAARRRRQPPHGRIRSASTHAACSHWPSHSAPA